MSWVRDWSERHAPCRVSRVKRDLALTLRMLEAEGLQAGIARSHGRLQVRLVGPAPARATVQASFSSRDTEAAADWLVARVFDLHPQSQLAKLWRAIAAAAAAAQDEWALWRSGGSAPDPH